MEHDAEIDLSKRKITSRLLVKRCLQKGWKITGFKTNPAVFLIQPPGREKPIKIFSAAPPQTSRAAMRLADDKFATNQILQTVGLSVPAELLIERESAQTGDITQFLERYKRIVVKPLDASHGHGVSMDVTTQAELEVAVEVAKKESNSAYILIQEQVDGIDVRVVCINYKYSNAMSRQPASIEGDGQHTVRQLISITNSSDERGDNYSSIMNTISEDKALLYVGEEVMNSIPAVGEQVQLIGISNLGAGGKLLNVGADVPLFMQEMAIKAAKSLDLSVAGVDFMISRLPKPNDTFEDLQPHIIEVNASPTLAMYDDLESPEQIALLDQYLDFATQT